MAELPAYHGRTHLPGGTDPIPLPASGLPVGFLNEGQTSKTIGVGATAIDFRFGGWNDDSVFDFLVITGSAPNKTARYLEVTPGTYLCHYLADFTTSFSAGDQPFLQPSVYFPSGGGPDVLSNTVDTLSMDGAQGGPDNQLNDEILSYHAIGTTTVVFSWTEAGWGEATMGLGLNVSSSNSRTKSLGAMMTVIRLGDAGVDKHSYLQTL